MRYSGLVSTSTSKGKPMTYLEQIQTGIRKFESLQTTFSPQGAADTEPDAIFQCLLKQAVTGADVVVPKTKRGWELYTSVADSSRAAEEMHKCASEIVRLIQECPVKELAELQEYIDQYCWRSPFSCL